MGLLLWGTAASAVSADAAAMAQGGVWIFERLDLAPGARVDQGRVACEVWRVDSQAGIDAAAVRIVQVQPRSAAAVAFEQLHSPVLRESVCRIAWQLRMPGARLRMGAGVQAARREFDRYGARWRYATRAGAGWFTPRGGASVAAEVPLGTDALPQLHAGVQWRASAHGAVVLQADPDPVRPGAWHAGWSWDAAGVRALAGYDAAANAVGVGLDVACGRVRVVWGARLHPALGWSHAWSCAWDP